MLFKTTTWHFYRSKVIQKNQTQRNKKCVKVAAWFHSDQAAIFLSLNHEGQIRFQEFKPKRVVRRRLCGPGRGRGFGGELG